MHLVLTGNPTAELANCVARHHVTRLVHFTGIVLEEKLPSLYRGAEALIFPSLYEGFGLPILEAMACGTPVVTANITAMPEVAGNAALLVDPTSVEQIASAMARIASDSSLRQELRENGSARAAQFPWERTISGVHEVLRKIRLQI
jgi:glycosyltransferase involved in cell wall biosynthesis